MDSLKSRSFLLAVTAGAGAAAVVVALCVRARRRRAEAESKWAAAGKDVVVLHQFPRPRTCIDFSPFCIKLETFLRVAGVKYVSDFEYPMHDETGKWPWITLNGEHVTDSQMCVEFVARKLGKDLGSHLSPKDKAVSRSLRVLLEDHLYWVLMIDRYVNERGHYMRNLMRNLPPGIVGRALFEYIRIRNIRVIQREAHGHGMLRLGRGVIQKMGIEDLEAVSAFLGTKSYVMGGEAPTEIDCVLFGFVAKIVYTAHDGSMYKTLVEKRLVNLHQHMLRMKAKYYPDWDELIKDSSEQKPAASK